jgi:hypothetical protein
LYSDEITIEVPDDFDEDDIEETVDEMIEEINDKQNYYDVTSANLVGTTDTANPAVPVEFRVSYYEITEEDCGNEDDEDDEDDDDGDEEDGYDKDSGSEWGAGSDIDDEGDND